ncbi:Retrovirus-related Pol polyprotein from type-2 retrotransposable element R2DM [Trichinella patagoniensis]|uniref:Retrovirus-related Pol polyprotein from type-2 retrotransposable element R2DM n=1 Tax=Trichinella patagoniensis TaxID=990121 RepID=A0A0V0Z618_9BILA|nr:Retrovirus-related Pol polyprotein from type-2 retrotransposable element R2DM [Trichinella patagoniensis]
MVVLQYDWVSEHLKLMNLGSASGPDGVKTFLLERHIPQILKDCRTTVIPKVDNPRSDAEDFRSITIGLCMYRLFSKIVTNPLSELTPLNPCHKAFQSGTDGAFDNVSNVASLLKLVRRTDAAPFTYKHPANSKNILSRIFPEEVTLHLQKMKVKTSAGPDGIQESHLRTCDPVCLAKAFNLFLLARYITQQLKDCRTTLMPKTDNPHPDAEDYEPITVASCLSRLFSKIVTRRLENCISLHLRQKAFRSGTDGAFDNTATMMTIIREAHLSTFSASSQKSKKYQWTTDHMRDVPEVEEQPAARKS